MQIQISELPESLNINNDSVFPIVFEGNTKKIKFKTLKEILAYFQSVTYNKTTGEFTFTRTDNAKAILNTGLQEAISTVTTENSKLIFTTFSGTEYEFDLSISTGTITEEMLSTELQKKINNKVDKETGKGLSTNDFTNELKQKLEGLNNYDDTEIKENITEIEKENTYQNKRLEYLEKNQIQAELKGEDTLTITDGAFAYANILKETEIEVEGKKKKAYLVGLPQGLSRQETEPTIENPSEIENVKAWNLFDKDNVINDKFVSNDIASNTSWCYYETSNLSINKKYIVNARTILSFYNEDTNISYLDKQTNFDIPISIPENTTKVYISIQKTNLETYMFVEEKDKDKPYAPYGVVPIKLENENLYNNEPEIIRVRCVANQPLSNSDNRHFSIIIPCQPNTTYSYKTDKANKEDYQYSGMADFNKYPEIGDYPISVTKFGSYNTITTHNNSKYLIIYIGSTSFAGSDDVLYQLLESLVIVKGTELPNDYIEHQEQNYNLHIKDLELNGIGNVRDSLLVELDDYFAETKTVKKLYLNNKIKSIEYDGSDDENWIQETTTSVGYRYYITPTNLAISNQTDINVMCNKLKAVNAQDNWNGSEGISASSNINIYLSEFNANKTISDFKTYLQENNLKVIYKLATPELIDLTETYPDLVDDIENIINNMFTYEEVTHINTPIGYMELTYTKSNKLIIKNYDDRISALEQAILNVGGN